MSDEDRKTTDEETQKAAGDTPPETVEGAADTDNVVDFDAAIDAEPDAPRDPADVILALNEENTDLKNKVMSVLADMENLRRRTEREVKDARQYAVANFARDMLSVSDNLSRALEAIPEEAKAAADETMKNLLDGVDLTARDLQNQLTKNGVQKLEPEGEKFDPNFHQAMFEVPNPELANGTVVQVVQAGYKIGERVLRPAMVGVSKGGPKGATQPKDQNAEPGENVDRSV